MADKESISGSSSTAGGPGGGANPPEGYRTLYQGPPLPPFYAAEMIRPHIGKTLWMADSGGRTRCGIVKSVPRVREDQMNNVNPVEFENERPLFLHQIVRVAIYEHHGWRK